MTTLPPQPLDAQGTIEPYDAGAMKVREALLALLRAWEEAYNLPRSIPTRAERSGDLKKTGHHNR